MSMSISSEARYDNDACGAPAYDPAILLKIILYAYSKGITSSRQIEQLAKENVVCMALAADTAPHFTTIAAFVSSLSAEITEVFRNVLLVCDEAGLIGKEMFAVDGVKLPRTPRASGARRRRKYLPKKIVKMQRAVSTCSPSTATATSRLSRRSGRRASSRSRR